MKSCISMLALSSLEASEAQVRDRGNPSCPNRHGLLGSQATTGTDSKAVTEQSSLLASHREMARVQMMQSANRQMRSLVREQTYHTESPTTEQGGTSTDWCRRHREDKPV